MASPSGKLILCRPEVNTASPAMARSITSLELRHIQKSLACDAEDITLCPSTAYSLPAAPVRCK